MSDVWCGKGIPPTLQKLAEKYKVDKKICRKCGAKNAIRATNCRKRACGHSTDLRDRHEMNMKAGKKKTIRTMSGVWIGKGYPPTLQKLAEKYKVEKKICRKCGATNPIGATNCRKRACGHSTDLRDRHKKEMKSGKKK
ncbi:hypothetical protein WR25_21164 [Diploscapter pachys]|uniref:Ubiquitin-ribosomal protein eL40 fusion protein n=1 Tax=Diploscapter pachys TaxID=2018661 RepID=A0A2A2LEC0_9BILA|nr:hypothetical protein WR25_21164 [Diploscapter pachys]